MPGVIIYGSVGAISINPNTAFFEPWVVLFPTPIEQLRCHITVAAVPGSVLRLAVYKTGNRWKPAGLPEAETASLPATATGTTVGAVTPVILQPGLYVAGYICDGAVTLRAQRGSPMTGSLRALSTDYSVYGRLYVSGTKTWATTGFPSAPNVVSWLYSAATDFCIDAKVTP